MSEDGDAGHGPVAVDIAEGVTRWVATSEEYPQYAYGLLQGGFLAQRLGLPTFSALELGVAGGKGLMEMERLAAAVGRAYGFTVEVTGFDLGTGLPKPADYRDIPYAWQPGFFAMDENELRSRLTTAKLALGDIAHTGRAFIASGPPPIGFISFDFDYYSSTAAAITALLEADLDRYLPRVLCYFDDTVGPHEELHCESARELLAIREFNERSTDRKIARINGLSRKLADTTAWWVEGIYVLHLFSHPRYNEYVYPVTNRQKPLVR
jgi:hypothetical protein